MWRERREQREDHSPGRVDTDYDTIVDKKSLRKTVVDHLYLTWSWADLRGYLRGFSLDLI